MKKEKKFLNELREKLNGISNKDKDAIVLKYENIIKEHKSNNERIVDILKNIGKIDEVANKEIEEYKNKNSFKYAITSFFSKFKNNSNNKKKDKKVVDNKKKAVKKVVDNKNNKKSIKDKIKELYDKINNKLKSIDSNSEMKSFRLYTPKKENKENKEKKKWNIKEFFSKFKSNKVKGKPISLKEKITKEKKPFILLGNYKRENTLKEEIQESIEDIKSELVNVNEIVPEKKIFETKQERRRRIILKTIVVIVTMILLFIWLWVTVILVASVFAFLDGVKFYGLIITLAGLDMLILSIIILINKSIFRRKISRKWPFLFIIFFVAVIAVGVALGLKQIYELKITSDVSEKYNMTKKKETYNLPSDPEKKLFISFNSNYHTEYIVDYDNTITDKVNIEVKYYECYYDYYSKKDNNNLYISLKLDNRDRLSVYIDDFKEGKIYDNNELERYVVKIIVNEKDKDRIVVQ